MSKYDNYYFKALYGQPAYMSGLPLPNPDEIHEFIDCEFHPRLWEILQQMYRHCNFINCNWHPAK